MQHYDVEIRYKPGSQMYLADTLSRAYLKNEARSPVEQEVKTIHMMDFLPISEPQLREIQEATQYDPTPDTMYPSNVYRLKLLRKIKNKHAIFKLKRFFSRTTSFASTHALTQK